MIKSSKPSTAYWMDVSDASYYIKTMKITKIKVAKWGTPKKHYKKRKKSKIGCYLVLLLDADDMDTLSRSPMMYSDTRLLKAKARASRAS